LNSLPIFMTARWEYLLMLNYEVPPDILKPYIPPHVELDLWQGKAVVSMVGFRFRDTRVFGFRWPLHTHFEEVNLRLYVRHWNGKEWKRGVAFVSEIVPRPIIAYIANALYNEHYHAMPTRHQLVETAEQIQVQYEWRYKGKWNRLGATAACIPAAMVPGSEEEFILQHYWGYNELNRKTTIEYGVEHPAWQTFAVRDYKADFDIEGLYGKAFVPYLSVAPQSIMLAKGSEVTIRKPKKITG
jgi:uncharacterized protein